MEKGDLSQMAMAVHVLPDKMGKVVGNAVDAVGKVGVLDDVGEADDAPARKVFDDWLKSVERCVRGVVKVHDKFVFIAARSLEDALYPFL